VYCVHFAFLGIEICGTPNVLIVTGLREKNSRRWKKLWRSRWQALSTESVPHVDFHSVFTL
jgi:hypothetical protein